MSFPFNTLCLRLDVVDRVEELIILVRVVGKDADVDDITLEVKKATELMIAMILCIED
jgi:hypothetical protein